MNNVSNLATDFFSITRERFDNKDSFKKIEERIKTYKLGKDTNLKVNEWRQLEKDETFWTASTFIRIIESPSQVTILKKILTKAFGEYPPLNDFSTWEDCLQTKNDDLILILEATVPAPKKYRDYLKKHVNEHQIIPYIVQQLKPGCLHQRASSYEGSSQIDAVLYNKKTEFAVFIESKVLSDISHSITYDEMRNQIARNVDIMLDQDTNINICPKESTGKYNQKINSNKTLFLLVTPMLFIDNWRSRHYGYKMHDYKTDHTYLKQDLNHRTDISNWSEIAKRLGWIGWEEIWEAGKKDKAMDASNMLVMNFPKAIGLCYNCIQDDGRKAMGIVGDNLGCDDINNLLRGL